MLILNSPNSIDSMSITTCQITKYTNTGSTKLSKDCDFVKHICLHICSLIHTYDLQSSIIGARIGTTPTGAEINSRLRVEIAFVLDLFMLFFYSLTLFIVTKIYAGNQNLAKEIVTTNTQFSNPKWVHEISRRKRIFTTKIGLISTASLELF